MSNSYDNTLYLYVLGCTLLGKPDELYYFYTGEPTQGEVASISPDRASSYIPKYRALKEETIREELRSDDFYHYLCSPGIIWNISGLCILELHREYPSIVQEFTLHQVIDYIDLYAVGAFVEGYAEEYEGYTGIRFLSDSGGHIGEYELREGRHLRLSLRQDISGLPDKEYIKNIWQMNPLCDPFYVCLKEREGILMPVL